MLFRPAESSKEIVEAYRRYLLSTFKTNREYYNRQIADQLSLDDSIANGPFISMSDSFAKDKSIRELVDEGVLCKSILKLPMLYPDRKLYKHQVEAIRKAVSNNNLVVTTGTGSGKTECFLIPVINQLMKEKEAGTLGPGVRTLVIYPMNALVNDQIRRLKEVFKDYLDEDITFGKYTGETKEKYKKAYDDYVARARAEKKNEDYKESDLEPRKNELISREQMRESPPNILITNYAMLEYLLLRPGDNVFFNAENSEKWRFIVLDEAHTYSGAKGIEVGSLLKRVSAMLGRNDIQYILTSATLGGKGDDPQIVGFAEALCNSEFSSKGIIRSQTVSPEQPKNTEPLDFEIYRKTASRIRDNYPEEVTLKWLADQGVTIYNEDTIEKSLKSTLYYMILHDSFYYRVRTCLLNQTKPLNEVAVELKTNTDDIADFIAVASNALINEDKIFEARYHMFLRGLEGVFVTLAPSNKLFLKKMETYKENPFSEDIGFKVYEISFCHNCEAIFIVGQTDSDGHLIQLSKINDDYEPEVYLIDGDYDPESEEEAEGQDNHYLLCSKCGAIARESSLDGLGCGHGKQFYNRIIKVKDKGEELHSCPCCHAVNTQRSILRPYFLGNEAATAVIATALYDELPNKRIKKDVTKNEDKYFGTGSTESEQASEEHLIKQFLTFSDNRQAAAFFASYLENTYQETLLKRLMTQVKLDNETSFSSNGIKVSTLVTKLEELMCKYQVCDEDSRHKTAWLTVAKEMINYKARNSLQNEGIMFFDIKIAMPENPKLGLSAEDTTTLFKILTLPLIKDGAFIIPVLLNDADIETFSHGRKLIGYVKDYSTAKYTKSWLPREGQENVRTRLIQKLFPGKDITFATDLLNSIWTMLKRLNVIVHDSNQNKFFINIESIVVRSVQKLYICDECKTVTPFNFKGKCACNNCNGHLEAYEVQREKKDDHYKRLYETLQIEPLVAKEHTAQLGSEKAYDYQNKFKNENINVLSCSTTFEMGVDVGTLETVFMRNMPPTPANYAQRAGRAGRSVNSAAYALTYCPNNSHDLNYFNDPVSMIKGVITPPAFNTNNEKIVLRHIFASAFSFFWKKHPELYKSSIGEFVRENGINIFKSYLIDKPDDLLSYLKKVVPEDLQKKYRVNEFGWFDNLFSSDSQNPGVFVIAEQKYLADLEQLQNALNRYQAELSTSASRDYNRLTNKLRAVGNSIRTIEEQQLIAFLSQNNLIPKYGFPVDTVELQSVGQSSFLGSLRLDRDLFTAISEYAPESQVVADGKLITSRYVRRLGEYEWPKYNYCFCDNCKTLNRVLWTEELPESCQQCDYPLRKARHSKYIIPKFGFIVDNEEPKSVGTSKPERTYKGSISYIGDGEKIETHNYSICGKRVVIGSSNMDELAVLNTSNFYICDECGYGKIFDDCYALEKKYEHDKPNGFKCSNSMLTPYALGHEFQTDVVQIKFESENIKDIDKAWTILYALLEGLSKCLHIDRNELSGCLHWYRNPAFGGIGNYDFILFDNTPGGAGYVRNLRNPSVISEMMEMGMRTVAECKCGGDAADTACYSCLCNYYNQKQHDILQRRYAIEFFNSMKNGMTIWSTTQLEEDDIKSPKGLIAVFNNDGQDQSGMSYSEIWDYLMQDTEDSGEVQVISDLKKLFQENKEKPFYEGSIRIVESGLGIKTNLIWKKSKVALFLSENRDGFEKAKTTDWKVFCTSEELNPTDMVAAVKGG